MCLIDNVCLKVFYNTYLLEGGWPGVFVRLCVSKRVCQSVFAVISVLERVC